MKMDPNHPALTAIVTVSGSCADIETALNHATEGLSQFKEFPGFIAGATHINESKNKIIQYLQWKDKESLENCIENSSWEKFPSSKEFMSLVKNGKLTMDFQVYSVVKSIS